MRRRFDMAPELYLEVGPDRFHTARLGPLRPGELFEVLRYTWDELQMLIGNNEEAREHFSGYVEDAVHDWNSTWQEDEGYDGGRSGWHWLGISVKAKCDELDVWVNRLDGEKGVCTVYVDVGTIDSAALEAARKAHAVLSDVVTKPGGNR